jgi:hypothetical protein
VITVSGGYSYLQDNLRTDMQFANDSAVAVYMQTLVPYKELDQTFFFRTAYELKQRLALNVNFAHSEAHSGLRPDLNPASYPAFPAADPTAFANALALASTLVSEAFIPQTIVGSSLNYDFRSGFDSGLRFNYGSYGDEIGRLTFNGFKRPDLSGRLRSYSIFAGKVW